MPINIWVTPPCGHPQPMLVMGVVVDLTMICKECQRWFRIEGGGWAILSDGRGETRGGKWTEVTDEHQSAD